MCKQTEGPLPCTGLAMNNCDSINHPRSHDETRHPSIVACLAAGLRHPGRRRPPARPARSAPRRARRGRGHARRRLHGRRAPEPAARRAPGARRRLRRRQGAALRRVCAQGRGQCAGDLHGARRRLEARRQEDGRGGGKQGRLLVPERRDRDLDRLPHAARRRPGGPGAGRGPRHQRGAGEGVRVGRRARQVHPDGAFGGRAPGLAA